MIVHVTCLLKTRFRSILIHSMLGNLFDNSIPLITPMWQYYTVIIVKQCRQINVFKINKLHLNNFYLYFSLLEYSRHFDISMWNILQYYKINQNTNHFKLFSVVYESSKEEDEYPSHNPFLEKTHAIMDSSWK